MDTPAPAPAPPLSAGPPAATAVAAAVTTAATTHLTYPDSVESSPRSRNTDSWDEPTLPPVPGAKLRLMCSYGGHIFPRPHDKSLCYLGGDTRIVVVDRHTSLADLSLRLSRSVLNGRPFTLKYQLPNEDLDSLITVTTDEDLENMIEEYDRTTSGSLLKPSRLRLFLFPTKVETASSIGTLIEDSKSDNWFVEALNGAGYLPRGASADAASVNCLLGLDDNVGVGVGSGGSGGGAQVMDGDVVGGGVQSDCSSLGNIVKQVKGNSQDVHSMPDSPMLETSSSFGSSSSSPSMVNLPPIRVHVEDHKMGLEDSFAQMGVSAAGAVPPPLPTTIVSAATTNTAVSNVFSNEIPNRIVSDDERSEHGVPTTGYRKPPQPVSPQLQQKISDLPSPEESSRDNGVSNLISRAKPLIYQEQVQVAASPRDDRVQVQVQGNSVVDSKRDIPDPNYRIQMQQVQDSSGYLMASQLDQQQQQQFQQQQQQQLQQQQQQQQLQQQQQQQQQYVHAGTHYIHHTSGPVPISSYYPIHHPQQQHQQHQIDQHYPMYFVPIRQTQQPYNISMQSNLTDTSSISSSRPPLPPNPTILTATAYKEPVSSVYPARATTTPKPELAANVYRTATTATPQIVHMQGSDQHYMQSSDQHYANYSHQMHHPPQSIAAASNYSYEFTDPAHSQIYYTQPIASTLPPQYQTMSSAAVITGSDMSSQLPVEGIKQQQQQQIRTSQPI